MKLIPTITTFFTLLFAPFIYSQGTLNSSLNNSFAICLEDSTLWTWGGDHLGNNISFSMNPNAVWQNSFGGILQKVVSTSTYYTHGIAALENGEVYTWGLNGQGQLGDSSFTSSTYPVQMRGENGFGFLDSIIEVSVGYYHSLMLKSDGTIWSCGYNTYGQLGVNSTQTWNYPVQVKGNMGIGFLNNVIQIDAGSLSSVALKNDGTVWVWGNGSNGTMANGGNNEYFPIQVSGLPFIVKVSLKGGHILALDNNGMIWSWGQNNYGQVGNNTFTNIYSPVQVLDESGAFPLDSIIDTGTGMMHSFAIHNDGTAYAWGANNNGQIGDGTTIDRYLPVKIKDPSGIGYITDIIELEGGHLNSIGRKSDGSVYCWGDNYTALPEEINGICENSVGAMELLKAEYLIYPNPLIDSKTLYISGIEGLTSCILFDINGKQLDMSVNINDNAIEINLSSINSGIYLIHLDGSFGKKVERIVVN